MRVLQIINSMGTGGAEKLLVETIPALSSQGLDIDLLVLNGKNHQFLDSLANSDCCNIYSLGKGSVYNPMLIFKIIPFLKKYNWCLEYSQMKCVH